MPESAVIRPDRAQASIVTDNALPLGIFGGTFDPVHYGHLRLAEEALDALQLAKVIWIPAGNPSLRNAPRVQARDRLAMVQSAIADNPRFCCDDREVRTHSPSYTVPTLIRLREHYGNKRPLVLLLGADAFTQLHQWHRWEELFSLAHLAVAHRPGTRLAPDDLPPALIPYYHRHYRAHPWHPSTEEIAPYGQILFFSSHVLDISATRIRHLLSKQQSPRYLLPEAVAQYIRDHHFYEESYS